MPAHQLLVDGIERIADGKPLFLRGHLRVEDGLQQEIAQLIPEVIPVATIDRIQNFVGLFQSVLANGVEVLLAIPGTPLRGAQTGHQVDQRFKPGTGAVGRKLLHFEWVGTKFKFNTRGSM